MYVNSLIIDDYPIVHPYAGVNKIEDILLENKYLVVLDEQKTFFGILTPFDIIERPHKIVIDCLGKMEKLDFDDTIMSVYHKMIHTQKHVLPVFRTDNFMGVVSLQNIVHSISNDKEITLNMLVKVRRELEEEKRKSRIAEKIKDNFLRNISHEIRTPLNGLIGFADIISSSKFSDFENKEYYRFISQSSQQFLDVVNELIEISRIQSGDIHYEKDGACSAIAIIDELYQYYSAHILELEKFQIQMAARKSEEDILFFSDLSKIKQILSYIVHNAVKFTVKGMVEIGFKRKAGFIVFYVTDSAGGIPTDSQDRVFIAFEKLDLERHTILPGIGLGLTIAKYLANSLEGDIWFDSVQGVGSTFYIQFPL